MVVRDQSRSVWGLVAQLLDMFDTEAGFQEPAFLHWDPHSWPVSCGTKGTETFFEFPGIVGFAIQGENGRGDRLVRLASGWRLRVQ